MKAMVWRFAGCVVLLWSVTACAQSPPKPPAPPVEPVAPVKPVDPVPPVAARPPKDPASSINRGPRSETPALELAMMPVERLEKPILLDDEIEQIRSAIPDFNCVIIRDQGVAKNYPTLPAMTLRNITVGQFLRFVESSFPGVQYKRIDGPSGPLYAIRIRVEDDPLRRQMAMDRSRVRLFRLNEFINTLADESPDKDKPREAKIKEATAQVLSLLQAALEQTDDPEPCVVKIHEPTLTLMFKGGPEKQAVLQEALQTLMPRSGGKPSPRFGSLNRNTWDYVLKDSDLMTGNVMERAMEAEDQANQLREQAAELRSQVKQLSKGPRPAPVGAASTQKSSKD